MSTLDRFLDYVTFDTQSDHESRTVPSTPGQERLAEHLKDQLTALGLEPKDRDGVIYVHIPGHGDPVGFLAHMDTAEELTGAGVRPRMVRHYDGSRIVLNDGFSMDPQEFPALAGVIGDDLVVTDGTTLLGGDDKAGVAILMQALEEINNTEHRDLWIAFTSDEEIGRGTDHFDLSLFLPDHAFTVDGDNIDQIDWQTFNAAQAVLHVTGTAIHPGEARGKMVNAVQIAAGIAASFPQTETPACTEGTEGFWHLTELSGSVDAAKAVWIIRDHDGKQFERRKQYVKDLVKTWQDLYPGRLDLELHDQYLNMAQFMKDDRALQEARAAILKAGLEPKSIPVRGGTDGAMLSAKGLFTPNLGTGSWNHHGRYEFASVQKMEQMKDIVKTIMKGSVPDGHR